MITVIQLGKGSLSGSAAQGETFVTAKSSSPGRQQSQENGILKSQPLRSSLLGTEIHKKKRKAVDGKMRMALCFLSYGEEIWCQKSLDVNLLLESLRPKGWSANRWFQRIFWWAPVWGKKKKKPSRHFHEKCQSGIIQNVFPVRELPPFLVLLIHQAG